MIPMQMGYENKMNLAKPDAVFTELHLGTFPTVNQKKPLIRIQQMSGRKSFRRGQSRTTTQYSQSE